MTDTIQFSPLALTQLDIIWDYGYERFGQKRADAYIDGLFDVLEALQRQGAYQGQYQGQYQGMTLRRVPPDLISDITTESIYFIRYKHEILYLKPLKNNRLGVVCILGERMDTPNRLLDMLRMPTSKL